jgi:hypothetical protein
MVHENAVTNAGTLVDFEFSYPLGDCARAGPRSRCLRRAAVAAAAAAAERGAVRARRSTALCVGPGDCFVDLSFFVSLSM